MIQKIKISELIVLENNPRTITKEGFEKLCKSIQQDPSFMEARPILVNNASGSFKVYGGNQRLLACKHLGWEEVPCDIQAIDEKTEKERVIKDNTHYGEFDFDTLANEFSDLDLNELGVKISAMYKEVNDSIESNLKEKIKEEFGNYQSNNELGKISSSFTPELTPQFSNNEVSTSSLEKASVSLDNKFKESGVSTINCICPKCGESFNISK